MSSFFTVPASQRKRKRGEKERSLNLIKRRRNTTDERSRITTTKNLSNDLQDESISGSDSGTESSKDGVKEAERDSSEEGPENETAAERRLRLAEQYLENIHEQIDETGFDAARLDRDLIAQRLQEDVSESNGKLYRHIASSYDLSNVVTTQIRSAEECTTSVAACAPYFYTTSKHCALTKWKIPFPGPEWKERRPRRRRPIKLKSIRGSHQEAGNTSYQYHTAAILCVAASSDGRFVATGGADKRLIVWSAGDLTSLRVFAQHRDKIQSLVFRVGTNQLHTASADRTIKTWSLNELAYVETLFGHQDAITDVAALSKERCLSAGSRDRTVRLWKVTEETQLVFRGGGGSKHKQQEDHTTAEGSIERVAFIDEETFVSGSDNGSLSLWSISKKKPVHTIAAAHGFDPSPSPEQVFADLSLEGRQVPTAPEARWITALATVPLSDLIFSGSWDGYIRAWQISKDKRRLEAVGICSSMVEETSTDIIDPPTNSKYGGLGGNQAARGFVNDIDVFEHGPRGQEVLYIIAALGKEHRLGRWKKVQGKNGAVLLEIRKRDLPST